MRSPQNKFPFQTWVIVGRISVILGTSNLSGFEILKRVFVLLDCSGSIGLTQMHLVFVVDQKTPSLSMLRPRFLSQLHRSVSSVSSTWFTVLSVVGVTVFCLVASSSQERISSLAD